MVEEGENKRKFYLDRAGKKVEVNLEHLRRPHAFQPRVAPQAPDSPLVMGGDHRPTAKPNSSVEDPKANEK